MNIVDSNSRGLSIKSSHSSPVLLETATGAQNSEVISIDCDDGKGFISLFFFFFCNSFYWVSSKRRAFCSQFGSVI